MFLCLQNIIWNLPKGPLHDSKVVLCMALPWVMGVQIINYTHSISLSSLASPLNLRIVDLTAYLASLLGCVLGISNITCSNWAPGILSLPHLLSTPHTRSVGNTYLPTTSRIQLLPTSAAAILVHATIIPLTWIIARPPARLPCLCPFFLFRLLSLQQLEWFCYHVSQVMSFLCSNPPRLLSSEKCHTFPSAFWLQATPSSDYISFYSPSRNKNSTKAWILSFLFPPEPRMVSGIQHALNQHLLNKQTSPLSKL